MPATGIPSALPLCFALSSRGHTTGGLETIADHLAAGLARRGHAVTYLAGAVPGRPRRDDLPPEVAPVFVPVVPWTSRVLRVAARLSGHPPLHLQSTSFFLSCRAHGGARRSLAHAAAVVTFLEGEAVLFSEHLLRRKVASLYYFSGGIKETWARRDRSTLRIAISETIAGRDAREHNYPCQGVVTPGVDAALLESPSAVERAGGDGQPLRLVYAGRLEPNKRVERLLPLLAALAPEFPGLTLRLLGDGVARAALEREADERGLQGHVLFLGMLPLEEVHAEFRQSDVLVLPSAYESFGLVALEAQAAGLPVVASDLPALREATGGHARLVPPGDAAAWIAATRALLADAGERRTLAQAGRAWAAQHTWEQCVGRFEGYVLEAIDIVRRSSA